MNAVKELCEGLKAWQHRLGKEKTALAEGIKYEAGVQQQEIAAQLQEVYEMGLSKSAATCQMAPASFAGHMLSSLLL